VVARLPARDHPARPRRERLQPHVADARSASGAPRRGCRPPAPCVPKERRAGGANESIPTSECHRRPEDTGPRTTVRAPPACSARPTRVGAFEALTLEARAMMRASGLERRFPDPDTLPSYRRSARSWPWDLPSPRARTPPGAIPTRLARAAWARARLREENVARSRAPLSLVGKSLPCASLRGEGSLRARSRVSARGALAPRAGVAIGDASDRLLHSETVTHVPRARRLPSAAIGSLARPRGCVRGSLSCRASRLVPVSAASVRAPRCTSGDTQRGHREARGRPMLDETGEDRVSRRDPHFGDRPSRRAGVVLPRASSMAITSDTLSPPPRRGGGSPSGECRSRSVKAAEIGSAGAS